METQFLRPSAVPPKFGGGGEADVEMTDPTRTTTVYKEHDGQAVLCVPEAKDLSGGKEDLDLSPPGTKYKALRKLRRTIVPQK
jgi:hypothetical protein